MVKSTNEKIKFILRNNLWRHKLLQQISADRLGGLFGAERTAGPAVVKVVEGVVPELTMLAVVAEAGAQALVYLLW
jgi:hypothetical protein